MTFRKLGKGTITYVGVDSHNGALEKDILKKLYEEDRKTAATREWRVETLESLCTKLQFTELKEDVWKTIDELNKKNKDINEWKFRLNRIDVRKYEFEVDEKNNQIICTSGKITDENLLKISEETKKKNELMNRFWEIINWTKHYHYGYLQFK